MKILLDFIPLVLFFIAYKLWGIFVATAVLMAATVIEMIIIYAIDKKLTLMHKATLVLYLIFGGLTLALHNPLFVKWKPSVLYAGFAIALAVAQWGFGKNFLRQMLGHQLKLPENVWNTLGAAWVAYCLFMAIINGYVAAFFSSDAWASFKLWGYVFPLVFLLGQGIYLSRHLSLQEPGQEGFPGRGER